MSNTLLVTLSPPVCLSPSSVCLSVCLSLCMFQPVFLSTCLYAYLHLSACLCASLSSVLPTCLPVCLSLPLSSSHPVCLSVVYFEDSLLVVWRHGWQRRGEGFTEVLQQSTDPRKVYRLVGSDRYRTPPNPPPPQKPGLDVSWRLSVGMIHLNHSVVFQHWTSYGG